MVWPDVEIKTMVGDETSWGVLFAASELEKDLIAWELEGRKLRKIDKRTIKGWNHFAHWDQPDDFLNVLADILHARD